MRITTRHGSSVFEMDDGWLAAVLCSALVSAAAVAVVALVTLSGVR